MSTLGRARGRAYRFRPVDVRTLAPEGPSATHKPRLDLHGHVLDAVSAMDRAWFEENPTRGDRMRPYVEHELCPPGRCLPPGEAPERVIVRYVDRGVRTRQGIGRYRASIVSLSIDPPGGYGPSAA